MRNHGGPTVSIRLHGNNYDEASDEANRLVVNEGLTLIHPFDDPEVCMGVYMCMWERQRERRERTLSLRDSVTRTMDTWSGRAEAVECCCWCSDPRHDEKREESYTVDSLTATMNQSSGSHVQFSRERKYAH